MVPATGDGGYHPVRAIWREFPNRRVILVCYKDIPIAIRRGTRRAIELRGQVGAIGAANSARPCNCLRHPIGAQSEYASDGLVILGRHLQSATAVNADAVWEVEQRDSVGAVAASCLSRARSGNCRDHPVGPDRRHLANAVVATVCHVDDPAPLSTVSPVVRLNRALLLAPSVLPYWPAAPAIVVTPQLVPTGAIFRMVSLSRSDT